MSKKQKKTEMPTLSYVGPPRYICSILEDMRECVKHLHLYRLPGLIEEAQALANRMENALGGPENIERLEEDILKLKDARRSLKQEVKTLIKERDKYDRKS